MLASRLARASLYQVADRPLHSEVSLFAESLRYLAQPHEHVDLRWRWWCIGQVMQLVHQSRVSIDEGAQGARFRLRRKIRIASGHECCVKVGHRLDGVVEERTKPRAPRSQLHVGAHMCRAHLVAQIQLFNAPVKYLDELFARHLTVRLKRKPRIR